MKIKYKADVDTFTIKNVTQEELSVVYALLSHVRMGDGEASDEAQNWLVAIDELMDFCPTDMTIEVNNYDENETVSVSISDPTIEITFD
jgi:hypothetical protein